MLPLEIYIEIFKYLNIVDFFNFSSINKSWLENFKRDRNNKYKYLLEIEIKPKLSECDNIFINNTKRKSSAKYPELYEIKDCKEVFGALSHRYKYSYISSGDFNENTCFMLATSEHYDLHEALKYILSCDIHFDFYKKWYYSHAFDVVTENGVIPEMDIYYDVYEFCVIGKKYKTVEFLLSIDNRKDPNLYRRLMDLAKDQSDYKMITMLNNIFKSINK